MTNHYKVEWSDEDNEYVATCTKFPSLSWLDEHPVIALRALIARVRETELYIATNVR